MRFAGTRIEGLLGDEGPDYGQLTQNAAILNSNEKQAGWDAMSQVGAQGIQSAADVEAAELVGAAARSQASADTFAAGMGMLGKIGGGIVGGIGARGLGGGGGSYSAGDANVMGRSMSEAKHIGSGGFTETVIDGNGIGPTTLGRWKK